MISKVLCTDKVTPLDTPLTATSLKKVVEPFHESVMFFRLLKIYFSYQSTSASLERPSGVHSLNSVILFEQPGLPRTVAAYQA